MLTWVWSSTCGLFVRNDKIRLSFLWPLWGVDGRWLIKAVEINEEHAAGDVFDGMLLVEGQICKLIAGIAICFCVESRVLKPVSNLSNHVEQRLMPSLSWT